MKNIIKKILKEEFEDLDWIKYQNPEPWEKFMFSYTNLKPKLEDTRYGKMVVYRDHSGEWIFFHGQNPKNGYVWFNYSKIWSVFETKFGFTHEEIQELLTGWLGEHYNLRGVTPLFYPRRRFLQLGEHYNLRGVTPRLAVVFVNFRAGRTLQFEGCHNKIE